MVFRLAWSTDIHLNFIKSEQMDLFCQEIMSKTPDGFVITGDISQAPALRGHLEYIKARISCPIWYVLGNHDYYEGSVASVRSRIRRWSASLKDLKWLPEVGVVKLSDETALVGHDGWYDGRYADWMRSGVELSDYTYIKELANIPAWLRLSRIQELADESANYLKEKIKEAFRSYNNVVVATHVPPFREACTYNGKISNDDWMPHFSSAAMGSVLGELASKYEHKKLLVLCGHTHGGSDINPFPNLRCITGRASYGAPALQKVFEF